MRNAASSSAAPDDGDYQAALAACARGDQHGLRQLYEREGARLLGVALRLVRNRSTAEDIVHDAFINIWNRAGSYDPSRGSARGWIYTVVRNLALNSLRDDQRHLEVDDEALDALQQAWSMEASRDAQAGLEWSAHLGRLQHCLQALEPARRQCVVHAYVDGYSHGEIAERLGTPLGTVKAWVRRSLLALKECMA